MRSEPNDRLRRELRAAVFRADQLREDDRDDAADEHLSWALEKTYRRLDRLGVADAVEVLRRWVEEANAAFAHAHLVNEFSLRRLPPPRVTRASPGFGPEAVPGLADWLDKMLVRDHWSEPFSC
jgi:hypothetical protein